MLFCWSCTYRKFLLLTVFVLFPFPRKVRFKSRKHHQGKNTNYTDKTRGSIPIHSTGVSWPFLLFCTLSLGSPTISSRMNWSVPLKLQVLLTQHHMVQGKIKKTWKLIWCKQCVLCTCIEQQLCITVMNTLLVGFRLPQSLRQGKQSDKSFKITHLL